MLKPCLTFLRLYCVRAMPHGVYLTEMSSSCSRVLTDYDEGFIQNSFCWHSSCTCGPCESYLCPWHCPKEFFVLHA